MYAKTQSQELELEPFEVLFAQVVRLAIRDARYGSQSRQQEATAFLWLVVPLVAELSAIPQPAHLDYLRASV